MQNVKNDYKRSKTIKKIVSGAFLLLLLLTVAFSVSACKKNIKSQTKNVSNYSLSLDFDDSTKLLKGSQKVDYINSTETSLSEVWFHLYPNAFSEKAKLKPVSNLYKQKAYPNGEDYGYIKVNSVRVEDKSQEVVLGAPDEQILIVKLNSELYPEERVNISIDYEVLLPNCLHRFGYGDNTYNFGNFYPIASIYENGTFQHDAYGNNGDPFYSEMANYDVTIIYDDDFTLASTGKQEETSFKIVGKKKTHIKASVVRDFAFVLSKRFQVISGKAGKTTVNYYYYDDTNAEKNLKAGIDSINTFNNLFGEYPYETYNVVKANFIHGGMEYPNLVYISDSVENEKDYINVIIHETAHQWWYGLVGSNAVEYAWQDEGLTEYSTLMFYKKNPSYEVNVKESVNASLSSYLLFSEICTSVYGSFDSSMTRNVNSFRGDMEYVYATYVKGVLFFDNLNELVGDKKFEKSLKHYFNENCFSNATPLDMISSFERVCKTNVKSFFDAWTSGKVVLQNYK